MKIQHVVMVVCIAAMSAFGTGCGSDCASVCEDSKDCPGTDGDLDALDCGDLCDLAEDLAANKGCEDEFDALYACGAELDDVCTDDGCEKENEALDECMDD
jgi:hypothetical protein